jgi:hypothetical protein
MKKAIVLTYAPLNDEEAELIKNTNIFKIACNHYRAELKPNIRLTADDIVDKCLNCDSCDVVSLNYGWNKKRVINAGYLPKRHTSLISCIDYLMLKGFTHILLVATNPDSATCKINKEGVDMIKDCLYLYKYSKEGNLDIPFKTVKEFIMEKLTDEEKILGYKEPPKKLLDLTVLTDACLYEVSTIGKDNASIENGKLINVILPSELKTKLKQGEIEVEYNGMIIKRITKVTPDKEEKLIEEETEKPVKKIVKKKVKK